MPTYTMSSTRKASRKTRTTRKARTGRKQRGHGFGFGKSMKAAMPQFNSSFSMRNQMSKGKAGMKGYMNQTRRSISNTAGQFRKGVNFGAMRNSMVGRPYNGGIPGSK